MTVLQDKLAETLPGLRNEFRTMISEMGEKVISEVTVRQIGGGMRGVRSLICDTSVVVPDKGLIIRGIPVLDLVDRLPEEIFYLLLTGDLPDTKALDMLQDDLKKRSTVPDYVWNVLDAMSGDAHPMTMLSTAILVMQRDSCFADGYRHGMHKDDYWKPVLEDALRIIARVPAIAAWIYRKRFNKGPRIEPDDTLDWASNFARMTGIPDANGNFTRLMRLYQVLHIDHEGGNVSAHTCHCVGSALSDPFYAVSAGLNGLSGPLHGLANQECLRFLLALSDTFGGVPSREQMTDFTWETLNAGRVIPGYGHAVLRVTDPRFTALRHFGLEVCPDDELFRIVNLLFETVPDILKTHGKAANPWPNVDAVSGALLHYFGIREFDYYTVLFGASRIMGLLAQLVLSRGIGEPIERPKSVSIRVLKALAESA